MRRRSAGDVFAILFVIAGGIPIVVWLGSWLYASATREQIVQLILFVVALYVAVWIRRRFQKR